MKEASALVKKNLQKTNFFWVLNLNSRLLKFASFFFSYFIQCDQYFKQVQLLLVLDQSFLHSLV